MENLTIKTEKEESYNFVVKRNHQYFIFNETENYYEISDGNEVVRGHILTEDSEINVRNQVKVEQLPFQLDPELVEQVEQNFSAIRIDNCYAPEFSFQLVYTKYCVTVIEIAVH